MAGELFLKAIKTAQDSGIQELVDQTQLHLVRNYVLNGGISVDRLYPEDLMNYSKENNNIQLYDYKNNTFQNHNYIKNQLDRLSEGVNFSPPMAFEVPNGKIVGPKGISLTNKNEIITQSVSNKDTYTVKAIRKSFPYFYLSIFYPYFFTKLFCEYGKGPCSYYESGINAVMHTVTNPHYGHWIIEYLPKMFHLSQYEEMTGHKPNIIINKDPPEWMVDSIEMLGIDPDRIISHNDKLLQISRLIVPISSVTGDLSEMSYSPYEYQWLQESYRRAMDHLNTNQKRVYVSRQGVESRSVYNFDENKKVLSKYGFEIIRPEELSFERQARIFAEAGIIIGPYGSGLSNVLFSKNATIIQLQNSGQAHIETPFIELLSHLLGHDFVSIDGRTTEEIRSKQQTGGDRNLSFVLSPDKLEKEIQSVISTDNQR